MDEEQKKFCADLVLTDAISDMSETEHITIAEARNRIIDSGACDALYSLETGLWGNGSDYFVGFYRKIDSKKFPPRRPPGDPGGTVRK